MKSNFCCCRAAYKKGKKRAAHCFKKFSYTDNSHAPDPKPHAQVILWSWSKSRSPTGWTKSLKLWNIDVKLSSNHLKKNKNRALSNYTSPPLRNAKKKGSERISWWIWATFDFCMLINLTRKWPRNEHCQGGLLHLLKKILQKVQVTASGKRKPVSDQNPSVLLEHRHKTGFLKDCQLKEKEKKISLYHTSSNGFSPTDRKHIISITFSGLEWHSTQNNISNMSISSNENPKIYKDIF